MKNLKNTVTVMIGLFLLITSCKESVTTDSSGKSSVKEEVFSSLSGSPSRDSLQGMSMEEIRVVLRTSSPHDRYALWVDKLNQVLSTNVSDSVKDAINALLIQLNTQIFDWNSVEADNFRTTTLQQWYTQYNSVFSNVNGTRIFYDLYDFDPEFPERPNAEPGTVNCDCDRSSMFGACQFFGSSCDNKTCDVQSRGCGFIAIYECTGLCGKDHPVPNPNPDFGID